MADQTNGTGLSLLQRFIPDGFSHAATSFVESLKINSLSEVERGDRRVILKRRNAYGGRAASLINFYFRLADVPIRFLSDVRKWRRWELNCFRMLNGDRFRAVAIDPSSICIDKIPGQSLWDHMREGTLNKRMLEAAGREFSRAHQCWPNKSVGPWSHADASMTNVIYDRESDRARLIDFEIVHEESLPAVVRHADDLRVFLLDMVESVPARQWLPYATAFLKAYGKPEVIAELQRQLVIPSGLALVWWNVRTNFVKTAKVERRLKTLRNAIARLALTDRSRGVRAPEPAAFHHLPGHERRNTHREVAASCD